MDEAVTMTDITLEQRAAMVRAMADVVLESTGETRESVGDIAFGWVCEVQEKALEAALRLSAWADWQPIETAPSGETVVVFWRELQDPYDTARYGLDVLEDGVWNHHEECHQHFLSVAPPGSHGPSESAPYTHWMKLGAPLPAAPRHETGEG